MRREELTTTANSGRKKAPHSSLLTPHLVLAAIIAASMSGCGSAPKRETRIERGPTVSKAPSGVPRSRGGGYYLDDGPGDSAPADLDSIPEPVPRLEPLHRGAMRPYVVMGQSYTPMTELTPYKARGVASWYGRRYHGKQTSSGEIYDMYAISAAHPTLPIPSYARVTNVANGKSVVVRVNDRGPFLDNRVIDLSYTAAHRLGVLAGGSAVVEVEMIIPDGSPSSTLIAAARPQRGTGAAAQASPAAVPPVAAAALASQRLPEADPILAIAAAARDIDPSARPSSEAQPDLQQVAAAPMAKAAASDLPGVYLQLGAFGSRENAESYLARAKVQVEWLAQLLHLFPRDGMYRVHAGPYASSSEARQAAERIALSLGVKPVVVTR